MSTESRTRMKTLNRRRDALLSEAREVQREIDRRKRGKRVLCNHCGRRSEIRLLTYIQTHFYVTPYSCTGGDYWSEGEGRFLCPKCGWENRLFNRPEVVKLKRHFARVEEHYGDEMKANGKWVPRPRRECVN